jgi:hypothetical protein
MKQTRYLLLPLIATGALLFTTSAWAKAGDSTRVGKTATVSFDHETLVGNLMFQPGDYTIRHRVIGANQFMVFQRTEENLYGGDNEDVGKPQRVACRMEPLSTKVSDTTAAFEPEGKIEKLTKIEIAEENVEHLF